MSLPRYPEYMDSGVNWLGEAPAHWEVWKLRGLARLESGHTPSRQHPEYWIEQDCVIPWFTLADVGYLREARNWLIDTTSQKISKVGMENSAARLLPAGTVLLSRTASVGFSGVTGIELAVSQDFAAWICGPRLRSRYLLLCLRAMKQEFGRLMMGSTHQTIYMPDIEAFRVPVPPLPEQDQIAEFLDRETAKIDALVAEQQRLIELLKEKRQAVISHAVTKGLNPDAPMKDSGIEWLGEIPAHWEVKKLKHLGVAITGLTYSPADVTEDDTGTLVLRSSNVQGGKIVFDDNVFVATSIPSDLVTEVGDILICSRNGSRALIGKNATIDEASSGITFGAFMTVLRSAHGPYLSWVLNSALFEFHSGAFLTATINQLTLGVLNNLEVPMPSAEERSHIVAFLADRTSELERLISEATRAITLLTERRSALISAAVTGQIDVRNEAP